ncbi:glycoside hydrolase family 2 protein [Granulicella arctica]|uniref:glycoside hydrolase family 2 protein n=1 Tax=Granulicella arctica TaxID=940613 RepID=UPI0021DFB6CE|nr:sugar-binding domain-containing protein [Granulicella arctica]
MTYLARLLTSLSLGLLFVTSNRLEAASGVLRQVLTADAGWKFTLGDPSGADASAFSDSTWRTVDLPHDWSIEGKPEKDNPTAGGGGFFPAGVGWYRKSFGAPSAWKGKRVVVEFDGVYRDSTVYLNGHKLGTHPYGYTGFTYDLTDGLAWQGKNVLAVRVDNSAQPNSRWYSGSGIYRHVRVLVLNPIHVANFGVFITTPQISETSATVAIKTKVANDSAAPSEVAVRTTLFDRDGHEAGKKESSITVPAGKDFEMAQDISVVHPALWSPASPNMYRAVSQISQRGKIVDEVTTPFGIRSLEWSAAKGFLLNGKSIKFTGGSVHHDHGPLGAASFDRAEERKVELLKAAGNNAVRTSHNQPSAAFLDACDRLGLLVLDEPFDTWKAHKVKFDYGTDFNEWWKSDLSALILRDRNHPSVVIWGIGNEIPELEVEQGREMGKQLANQVRSLDKTRPLTLAFPGTTTKPVAKDVFSQLDITGYNYSILPTYEADHQMLPQRLMLTTESFPNKVFPLWAISQDNPYVLGDLVWTSMDYLGESGIGAWSYGTPEQEKMATAIMGGMMTTETVDKMFVGMANGVDMTAAISGGDPAMKEAMAAVFPGYPWHASACGDLDLTGFRKPQSYYRDILWNGGDRVYATVRFPEPEGKKIIATGWAVYPTLPSWNWAGQEGKEMQVEVYSGAEKVRLYLNDKLIGEKPTGREQEFKTVFSVPYTPGVLKAVGVRGDRSVAESIITTAKKAIALKVTADRQVIDADGQDLSYLVVEAVDADGHLEQTATNGVQFALSGPVVIQAVGNGDGQDGASYHSMSRKLYQGRAIVVVRTSTKSGRITVKASVSGLTDGSATVEAKPTEQHSELR